MNRKFQVLVVALILGTVLFLGACSKKAAKVVPPPPPPPAAAPTVAQAAKPAAAQPAPAKATTPALTEDELFAKSVKDVYFDYDKSGLRSDQASAAQNDAGFLSQHPEVKVVIEGHCDDRGSEVYNLALGDSRANAVKNALLAEGVSEDRVKTVSYGKEKPFCAQDNEQCWQQNRRDHFSLAQ